MYDDSDLDAAVAARQITPLDAQRLRRFVAGRRDTPPAEDTHFRYWAGGTGALAAAALILLGSGVLSVAAGLLGVFAGVPIALGAWWLGGRFAEARAGVPSTLLFIAFVIGTATTLTAVVLGGSVPTAGTTVPPTGGLVIAGGCALASWTWWRKRRLPIAIAAALLAALTMGDHGLRLLFPDLPAAMVTTWMLASALIVLAVAMWWDMTDIYRQTIRADVAFWLHLLAGFKLAASGFRGVFGTRGGLEGWSSLQGVASLQVAPPAALLALLLFAAYLLLALAIDRRAVLIASLIFVPAAVAALLPIELQPLGAVLAGGGTLALVLRWVPLRRALLARLPRSVAAQLPRTDASYDWERPIA